MDVGVYLTEIQLCLKLLWSRLDRIMGSNPCGARILFLKLQECAKVYPTSKKIIF